MLVTQALPGGGIVPRPPVTLDQLRLLLVELQEDASAAAEALAAILHRLDEHERCLRVILKLTKHDHGRKRL